MRASPPVPAAPVAALLLLLAASPAHADSPSADATVDITPFASLDVSRWSGPALGFPELEDGPAAVRDADPRTSWKVPGADGESASITFDWSSVNGIPPFDIARIRIDMSPASAAVTVDAGADLGSLTDTAIDIFRDATGALVTFRAAASLRVLRFHFSAGTAVTAIDVRAPGPFGALSAVQATCDDDGVHLAVQGDGVLGVEAARALPGGGEVRVHRRLLGVLGDASVRFDKRPSTYAYQVAAIGSDAAPQSISVTCDGPARTRPTPGPIHGVIEGFYGRPWTWHERAKVVASMGALGLDTYVYAPKDDPMHRATWRVPYDATAIAQFKALADLGRGVGVDVVWAISPGLDIDASSKADVDALTAKVSAVATGAGIRDAALSMDDISALPSGALGKAHAALETALLASMRARDPAARLWFVPTVYQGLPAALAPEDKAYLQALSASPPDVPIAWTGSGVFAKTIQLADGAAFVGLAGRGAADVWVWDNYPVNDVAVFKRLYARPTTGRESLLPGSAGLLCNPMRHALASLPVIASYAELAHDPSAYAKARAAGQPLATAKLALALADAESPPLALAVFFAELVHHDTLFPDDYASPELTAALAAYKAAPKPGAARRAAALELATRLARLVVADVDLRRDLDDQALSDEIDAFARATMATAQVVLDAMTGDRAALLGDGSGAAKIRTQAACGWLSAAQPAWRTIQDAVTTLVPTADTTSCAPGDDPFVGAAPIFATLGELLSLNLTDPGGEASATWALVDSAGATLSSEGKIVWTPSRLGHYRMVVLRSGDTGVGATAVDVAVVEKKPGGGGLHVGPATKGCSCIAVGNTSGGSVPEVGAVLALVAALALRLRRG